MHRARIAMTALLSLFLAGPAAACEMPAVSAGVPMTTRKPVLGDNVLMGSGFGMHTHPLLGAEKMHTGLDWKAPLGTPVVAAGRGIVSAAGYDGGYGNRVVIDHGGQWQSAYAHLSSYAVKPGDCVDAGTKIGAIGSTGMSAEPHLHFEVLQNGEFLDPLVVKMQASGR